MRNCASGESSWIIEFSEILNANKVRLSFKRSRPVDVDVICALDSVQQTMCLSQNLEKMSLPNVTDIFHRGVRPFYEHLHEKFSPQSEIDNRIVGIL